MKLEGKHGVVKGSGTYKVGSSVTLTVTPDEGYEFVQWEDGVKDNPRTIVVTKGENKFVALYSKVEVVVPEEVETKEVVTEEPVEETIDLEKAETEVEAEPKPKKTTSKKKKTE